MKDIAKYDMRFKYPDVRYKLNFKRIVGDKWVDYLERNVQSEQKMKDIIMEKGETFRYSELPALCDKLKMNLLILQEDPSYAIKFWDIIEKSNSIKYFSKDDNVDREKFMKWWFTDYLTIYKANQDRTEAEKDMERKCFNVGCKKNIKNRQILIRVVIVILADGILVVMEVELL